MNRFLIESGSQESIPIESWSTKGFPPLPFIAAVELELNVVEQFMLRCQILIPEDTNTMTLWAQAHAISDVTSCSPGWQRAGDTQ